MSLECSGTVGGIHLVSPLCRMGRYETLLLSISGVAMARLTAVGLCGLAAVASLASPAFGAPAELDPSFSGDGKARTNFT
jgi:hypothetical protein